MFSARLACALPAGEFRSARRQRAAAAPLLRDVSDRRLRGLYRLSDQAWFCASTAGDLAAVTGVVGLLAGVWLGLRGLAGGVDLGRSQRERGGSGLLIPALFLLLLLFVLLQSGLSSRLHAGQRRRSMRPGWHRPGVGLLLGALAQRSRFCITGSVRDTLLLGRRTPLTLGTCSPSCWRRSASVWPPAAFILACTASPAPIWSILWSFLGMVLVGWVSVLIGGCPFRQLVKAGEGDADAGLVVVGMFVGGGLVQSWGIAATAAGCPLVGKMAVLIGFVFVLG